MLLIEIGCVPRGDAPEEYRRFWVGMRFVAFLAPASRLARLENLGSRQAVAPRNVYVVNTANAVAMMTRVNQEAGRWFSEHCRTWLLAFCTSEAHVVEDDIEGQIELSAQRQGTTSDKLWLRFFELVQECGKSEEEALQHLLHAHA